jgi:hypothetical protein
MRAKRKTLRTRSTKHMSLTSSSNVSSNALYQYHFASAMASQEPKNGAVSPPIAAAESTLSPKSLMQRTAMCLWVPLIHAASHVVAPDIFPVPFPPSPLPPPLPLQRESVEAGDESSYLPSDRRPLNLKKTDLAVACKRIRVPCGRRRLSWLIGKRRRGQAQIEELTLFYHEEGREDVPVVSREVNREPKWTGGDSIKLI